MTYFSVLDWILCGVGVVLVIFLLVLVKQILSLRRVVPTNEVHTVRRGNKTLIYGADVYDGKNISSGNTYYKWPTWLPFLGVSVNILPLSVFDIRLNNYPGYDKNRLPFALDIQAFFRISNYKLAASRISNFDELKSQLTSILQGSSRSLLANEVLSEIMGERNKYGEKFTLAIAESLKSWGVESVKNIEFMDIRDASGECVIENIMKKKKSEIEKDSRVAVAENNKAAVEAEISAKQSIELRQQDANESVGQRKAEVSAKIGLAQEESSQRIKDAAKITKEKEMAVIEVEKVRNAQIEESARLAAAEIQKKARIVEAETSQQQIQIAAEAQKTKAITESEGKKIAADNDALAIKAVGEANAEAENKRQMASVNAQIALSTEIGTNTGYQDYLVKTQYLEAYKNIGIEQAKNLGNADIKIIAGAGDVQKGVAKAADALSPNGGFALGGMLEALTSTDEGKKLLDGFMYKVKPKQED